MLELTIHRPDGREIAEQFTTDEIMVGRHEKCDLRLIDSMVSRNHCLIFRDGKRFLVKDLESSNGTWVNGRRIKNRRRVKDGDTIQVGPFRILFSPKDYLPRNPPPLHTQTVEMERVDRGPFVHKHETEKVVKPLGIISNYLSETTGHFEKVPPASRRERLNQNLLTLYRITEELVTTRSLDDILDYIMDQIFEIFSPSQATILLRDEEDIPVPKKQKCAEGKANIRDISATIINRILSDRVAILTDNALEDPRFEMGDSVVIDGIRSVMAAPIWEDRSILGVIYVDSLDIVGGYEPEDLDLLTAIGHQAALAIQRWKLTDRLAEEAVKNALIRESLGRYHSAQVVDMILDGVADLDAKETRATIFFCDISGFTTLCETSTPTQLRIILNLFFESVNEVVFEEQGTLDKFLGDGAMAIFGAPLKQEDHPLRAVRAALAIRKHLSAAVNKLPPELRFSVRYGINTGDVVVGNFGSEERMEYTVLGHAVNIAARISKAAEPQQIVIGPETYKEIKRLSSFDVRGVGSKRLKGVKGRIKLYEVLGT